MNKRIAIVTGANGGLGETMCKGLHDQGRLVIAACYDQEEESARQWHNDMKAQDYEFELVFVDIANFDSCTAMHEQVRREFGQVSILVNNAGITRDSAFKKMPKDNWDAVLTTNLDGIFNMTRPVFESMCESGWGRIVNISSLNGEKGQFGQANYSAAKSGIYGLTKTLAQESARKGVTVNSISPGYIATSMVMAIKEEIRNQIIAGIPVGRLGDPEEVARVVTFLTDDMSGFITGEDIAINGGQYMS